MASKSNPVVWFEVMAQGAAKLRGFYGELLDWQCEVEPVSNYAMIQALDEGIQGGIG